MPRAAHRPSQRGSVLDAALTLLRDGGTLSLDSAARAAGVTKPGLMYHFATKEALVAALLDHLIDGYERELVELLPAGRGGPTTRMRITAYVRWALTHAHDAADLVILSDPRLREQMTERWVERLREWVDVPADLPDAERAALQAVRLVADGCWFADATGILPVPDPDRAAVLSTALALLEAGDA